MAKKVPTLWVPFNGVSLADRSKHIVSVNAPEGFGSIHYTTDGTGPNSGSATYSPASYQGTDTLYYDGVLVPEGAVFSAIAFKGNEKTFVASLKIERIALSSLCVTDNGTLLLEGKEKSIVLFSAEDGAAIYYTTDGTDPRTNGVEYAESSYYNGDGEYVKGMVFDPGTTIKAALKTGKTWSDVVTYTAYVISGDAPQIRSMGEVSGDDTKQIIEITSTLEKGAIFYTTDGSSARESSTIYNGTEYMNSEGKSVKGILVSNGAVVTACARNMTTVTPEASRTVCSRYEMRPSAVNHGSPKDDSSVQIIELSSSDSHAQIFYTTDGTEPAKGTLYEPTLFTNTSGEIFPGILVKPSTSLRVVAVNGLLTSPELLEMIYSTSSWAPGFRREGVSYTDSGSQVISLSSSDSSASIYYTTDGSDPKSGTLYSASSLYVSEDETAEGILVQTGSTIRAVAKKDDSYSDETDFLVRSTASWTPTITYYGPSSETDGKEVVAVSIPSYYSGCAIYYTTDGSDPVNGTFYEPSSCKYYTGGSTTSSNYGILVDYGSTVKVVALTEDSYSAVAEKTIDYSKDITLTIQDSGALSDDASKRVITLTSSVSNAEIYYSLDDTNPGTCERSYNENASSLKTEDGNSAYGISIDSGTTLRAVSKMWGKFSDEVKATIYSSADLKPTYTELGADSTDESRLIISLSSVDMDAKILYTTDDTDPKDGSEYTPEDLTLADGSTVSGISLAFDTQLRAVSYNSLGVYSDELEKTLQVAAPRISGYGVLKEDKKVIVISLSGYFASDSIYYTTDGSDPTTNGVEYKGKSLLLSDDTYMTGIEISSGTTVRAVSKKGETYSQELNQLIYSPDKWTPTAENLGTAKEHEGYQVMALSPSDSTDSVYYTVDGSDPKTAGILYEAGTYSSSVGETLNGVLVATGATVKACSKDGDMYSDVVEMTAAETSSWAPKFVNNGGSNKYYQIVTITSSDPDVEIYYTDSSSTSPKKKWSSYSASTFTLSTGETAEGIRMFGKQTIKATAKKGDLYSDSTEFYVADTISWAPTVSIQGMYQVSETENAAIISLATSSTDECTVYYTTDGKDPRTDGTAYMGMSYECVDGVSYTGIKVPYDKEIKCVSRKATEDGDLYSDVVVYTIEKPTISIELQAGGQYTNSWFRCSANDSNKNYCYKTSGDGAVMKITFTNFGSLKLFLSAYSPKYTRNSSGVTTYDGYVVISKLDASTYPANYSKGKTSTYNYTSANVEYTNLTPGEHYVYVVFERSNSNSSSYGLVYIPKYCFDSSQTSET